MLCLCYKACENHCFFFVSMRCSFVCLNTPLRGLTADSHENQTVSSALPFALRRERTLRPFAVAILALKP